MLVSYKWLNDYLNLDHVSATELADKITLTGIEVDNIYQRSLDERVVVGEVISCEAVPGSDHLNVTKVNVGDEHPLQIVCGAPNVATGMKVIVAKTGAVLPGDFQIKQTTLMDIESHGMICSLEELGIKEDVIPKYAEEGIFSLPDELEVGTPVAPYLGLDDTIIELDVTPNRSDALSMRGIAHEVGAILDQEPTFEQPEVIESSADIADCVDVSVEDANDVPYYSLRVIENVTIGESPLWLQRKLMNAGIRPVDVAVDVTNYVMLEYGQPLHAFDYDRLPAKEMHVRRSRDGETMTTLDGKERTLTAEQLVIASGDTPVAIAGVMGGKNSEVTPNTTTIALETAQFNPTLVRKMAQQLNLRSQSSMRFEKGLNTAAVKEAADLAVTLIAELTGGQVVNNRAEVGQLKTENTAVSIAKTKLEHTIGIEFDEATLASIWRRLGFEFTLEDGQYMVAIPPRRPDIRMSADLVEEVARIYGYNRLPSTLPKMASTPGQLTAMQRMKRHVKYFLEQAGMHQAISYALTTPQKATLFNLSPTEQSVELAYPMSEDHKTLRQSIVSGLLDNAQYNHARQMKNIRFYELGRTFFRHEDSSISEKEQLGLLLSGEQLAASWNTDAKAVNFFDLKGIIEELLTVLGISEAVRFQATKAYSELHPGQAAEIYSGEKLIGLMGQLHPTLVAQYDLEEVYVAELDLTALATDNETTRLYHPIAKFPASSRDIALLVDQSVTHQAIVDVIEAHSDELLVDVKLFDLYEGEHVEAGKKSVAYSLTYQNPEANLKDEEVDVAFNRVKQALVEQLDATIR